MNEQGRNTFERHPAYDSDGAAQVSAPTTPTGTADARVPATGDASATPGRARSRAAVLVSILGVLIALVTVGVGFALMRWAPEPAAWFVVVTLSCLLVLSGLAVVAGRVGGLATFVVISLLLPFVTTLAVVAALGQRLEDGLDDLFGSSNDTALTWGTGTEEDGAQPSPAEDAVTFGEPGQANDFTVTVAGLECGDTLELARENPAYVGLDDAPEYVDAEADAGKQFCVLTSSWSNTSKKPGTVMGWSSFNALATADGVTFATSDDDTALSARLTGMAGYDGDNLNPGDEAEIMSVFTVAADQEFTHAVVEQFDLETPEVWFALQ